MNSITIAGNIARDIEIRQVGSDSVGSFSVADNQGKDKQAIFWNCQIWGKRATSLAQYLVKGQAVTVSGTVSEREYQNRDGVTVKSMDVRVNDVALQGGQRQAAPTPSPTNPQAKRPAPAPTFSDMDDDISF
jgi:single-strand DNA-binding protein